MIMQKIYSYRIWKNVFKIQVENILWEELFFYLTQMIINYPFACKEVYVTVGQKVLCQAPDADLDYLQPCTHEETDSRMILSCL